MAGSFFFFVFMNRDEFIRSRKKKLERTTNYIVKEKRRSKKTLASSFCYKNC